MENGPLRTLRQDGGRVACTQGPQSRSTLRRSGGGNAWRGSAAGHPGRIHATRVGGLAGEGCGDARQEPGRLRLVLGLLSHRGDRVCSGTGGRPTSRTRAAAAGLVRTRPPRVWWYRGLRRFDAAAWLQVRCRGGRHRARQGLPLHGHRWHLYCLQIQICCGHQGLGQLARQQLLGPHAGGGNHRSGGDLRGRLVGRLRGGRLLGPLRRDG
mmetsp:Transcript_1819/g.3586  ORF Transcript_1819/g.3586 Transcript_1819/m.3586 type:complete len:211 (-) Transcript_1819:427-1059(-)